MARATKVLSGKRISDTCRQIVIATCLFRERHRDDYRQNRDPIREDRLLWRVQAVRHPVRLLHEQASGAVETGSRNIDYDVLLGSGDRAMLSSPIATPPFEL